MTGFSGAIFDLDGTLLDSMGVWEEIDAAFLNRRGFEVPADYLQAVAPLGFRAAADYTIRRFGLRESAEALIEEWDTLAVEAYQVRVPLKSGARQYLLSLKERGVRLAVATASREAYYVPALKNNGIYEWFDAFTSLSEVERGKGYPDVYWRAAEKIGVPPSDCAVFEDILAGVRGAKAGGFYTVAVYDSHSAADRPMLEQEADRYIEGFHELLKADPEPAASKKDR